MISKIEDMVSEHEVVDGKRIPMRYWDFKLSTQEITTLAVCITQSVVMDCVMLDNAMDKLTMTKLLKDKTDLVNKLFKTCKFEPIDKKTMDKFGEAIQHLEDLRERTKYIG